MNYLPDEYYLGMRSQSHGTKEPDSFLSPWTSATSSCRPSPKLSTTPQETFGATMVRSMVQGSRQRST